MTGSINVDDPSGDGRLTLSEIVSGSFGDIVKPTLLGGAVLRLDATVDFSTISSEVGAALPSIRAQILVDFVISFQNGAFTIGAPGVAIGNITLDLGKFISEFAAPILNSIKAILDPLEWLIGPDGFLNALKSPRLRMLRRAAGTASGSWEHPPSRRAGCRGASQRE